MWYLLYQLFGDSFGFSMFSRHTTLRGALAGFTAFLIGVLTGPYWIELLKKQQLLDCPEKSDSETIRQKNATKSKTPTMGGIIIIFAFLASMLCWARLDNSYVLWAILATIGFGLVGFLDDMVKAHTKEKGLTPRGKMALMLIVAVALAIALWRTVCHDPVLTSLYLPFLRDFQLDLSMGYGFFFIMFAILVMVGSSNAVNLTDGMDGLATSCTIIVATAFGAIAYIVGRKDFAHYLSVAYIPGAGELAICCMALVGAGLAFLWFNCYPASIFMGDCGSLMLGGFLGYVAVALRQEILLLIVGGIFVMEAVSVILQVTSYKLTKKRIFRCAPLHHHFAFKGWNETKVTMRFIIIQILLAMFAVATLKLR